MGGQTGPVFYIYYEGDETSPLSSHERRSLIWATENTDLRLYQPYPPRWITKKNDSFRLETLYFSPSSSTHSVPAAAFSISAWLWRAAEGRISFFRKRTQKSTGSRHLVCGSTSPSWKPPVLSESIPASQHASQTGWKLPPSPLRSRTPMAICSKSVSDGNKGGPWKNSLVVSFRTSIDWQDEGHLCCFDTRPAFLLCKNEPAEMNERIQNGLIELS